MPRVHLGAAAQTSGIAPRSPGCGGKKRRRPTESVGLCQRDNLTERCRRQETAGGEARSEIAHDRAPSRNARETTAVTASKEGLSPQSYFATLRTAHSRWSSRIAVRGGRKRAATCRTHATARRKRQTELCGLCAWCCSVSLQRCISNNHLNLRKIIDKKLIKTIANAIAAETHHAE